MHDKLTRTSRGQRLTEAKATAMHPTLPIRKASHLADRPEAGLERFFIMEPSAPSHMEAFVGRLGAPWPVLSPVFTVPCIRRDIEPIMGPGEDAPLAIASTNGGSWQD